MKASPGGVTLLVLNLDQAAEAAINVPIAGDRYTLTAPELQAGTVLLNGTELRSAADGSLADIKGQPFKSGALRLPPLSSTFLTLPAAHNPECNR
jgi:hypothetical protein